jgi:glyoxylase-like metal-dependent hydrolase (beta-lactamase superfamily II)
LKQAHNPSYKGPPTIQQITNILEKTGLSAEELTKEFGSMELEPIIVDEQVADGDMIGSLKVIHTPGHTPGHISLYHEQDRILFGADTIYKHVFGAEGMYISPAVVSIDPVTAAVSAQRLSKVKFDKLLMSYQDSPIVEKARESVEKLVSDTLQKLNKD